MDKVQDEHERGTGATFMKWYNNENGTNFTFVGRADEAPDLVYRDGSRELGLEIATAYYDNEDAKVAWMGARHVPNAPTEWSGVNFDDSLLENINSEIVDKCGKDYGRNCVLVLCVIPAITTVADMDERLGEI